MATLSEIKEKRVLLRKQNAEILPEGKQVKLICGGCGKIISLFHAYKCYFCRLWFCWTCAGHHFKKPCLR